jgi:CheY-like chemotaxis protein
VEGAVEDITERKQAEEAFLMAREADRASRAKSEFLSRMSHELRTPLNAILGFAQLLEMDSLSPEQQKSVAYILSGGRHLLELVNEVLDIARIEAGRLTISLEPVSLPDVVGEILDLAAPLAAEMNVQFSGGEAIPDRHVLADNQRLKQVLLNLVSNAIKYNRTGGRVTLSYEATPGGRLRIKVSDTGAGIPPEQIGRLFTPFERLEADTAGIVGTGLGLALSKRLVEAMGGMIGAESTIGRGSTFWAEFPLVGRPGEPLQGDQEVQPPAARGVPSIAGVVLYVEDNLSNVKLIENLLTHRPAVRLITAMQGELGLDLARRHLPHLILLDLHLPDIPGDEVLRRLREAPETRYIPVVVISADATPGQIDHLLSAGAWVYLTKPLDVKRFLSVLDAALQERDADPE